MHAHVRVLSTAIALLATGCLLLDDLRIQPGKGGAGGGSSTDTGPSSSTHATGASVASTGASSSTGASTSTGCATPPGNPAECASVDGSCADETYCTCTDCWSDTTKCPASHCDADGICEHAKETCLCCDCADAPECNP